MEVRSPIDGAYASIQPAENFQRWLSKGETIGEIIPEGDWLFYAIVSQKDSTLLFDQELRETSIRFPGSAAEEVRPTEWLMVPGQQEYLPALGWRIFPWQFAKTIRTGFAPLSLSSLSFLKSQMSPAFFIMVVSAWLDFVSITSLMHFSGIALFARRCRSASGLVYYEPVGAEAGAQAADLFRISFRRLKHCTEIAKLTLFLQV